MRDRKERSKQPVETTSRREIAMMKPDEGQTRVQADRRKNLRSPLIVLKAKIQDGKDIFFGYAKNISRGGMFIASVNPQEPGGQFQVEFTLPGPFNRKVQCICEVVWKRLYARRAKHEPGMGLKFLDLPEDCAEAIDAWVRSAQGEEK